MGLLEVDTAGLRALAADCQSRAAEVAATSVPQPSGPSGQPSAAAVGLVYAGVGMAAQTLSARMQSTATTLTAASAEYAVHEANSATRLRGLATEV